MLIFSHPVFQTHFHWAVNCSEGWTGWQQSEEGSGPRKQHEETYHRFNHLCCDPGRFSVSVGYPTNDVFHIAPMVSQCLRWLASWRQKLEPWGVLWCSDASIQDQSPPQGWWQGWQQWGWRWRQKWWWGDERVGKGNHCMVHYVHSLQLSHFFALILFLGKYLTINQLWSLLPLSTVQPLMHSWQSTRHKKWQRRLPPELHRNTKLHHLLAPADPIMNMMHRIQSHHQVIPRVRATARTWMIARQSQKVTECR